MLIRQVIEDYQIVILSSDHFNDIVYEGPQREKQIYLYHHDNHFDVITSISSLLLSWEKATGVFNAKKVMTQKHSTAVTRYANAVSLKGVVELLSYGCHGIIKCKTCNKVMSHKKRRSDAHMCGEVMCWNCEEYVDPNTHLCYMKPIVNEDEEWQGECKKKQKARQKRREMTDNEVEEDDEDEEGQEYLFFDMHRNMSG